MTTRAFTIVSANFLPQALTLRRTWTAVHPEVPLDIVLIDRDGGDPLTASAGATSWQAFGRVRADMVHLASAFEVKELATAVKPPVMLDLFDQGATRVLYLDPDLWFVRRIPEAVDAPLADIVLTPHITRPLPDDGLRPEVWDFLAAGIDNLGFASVGVEARSAVEWWAQHLHLWADREVAEQRFTDQRPADYLPALADAVVVRDTGWNVAYWNLHERPLREVDGVLLAGASPLRFFHFSGFTADDPLRLSYQYQPNLRTSPLTPDSPIAALAMQYASELAASHRELAGHSLRYGWSMLPNGVELTPELVRLYRGSVQRGRWGMPVLRPPLSSARAADELVEWALDADPDHHRRTRFEVMRERTASHRAPPAPPAHAIPQTRTLGVHLVGFLDADNGLGEAARRLSSAFNAAGVPVDHIVLPHPFANSRGQSYPRTDGWHTHVVMVTPPDASHPVLKSLPLRVRGARRVGVWFWEVDQLTHDGAAALAVVDEVWTSSGYLDEVLRRYALHRVQRIELPAVATPRRSSGVGAQFVTVADLSSGARRKNVDGAVDAYLRAVPAPREGVRLVVKAVGGHIRPAAIEGLARRCAGRLDIDLQHGYVSPEELAQLIASSDCMISLHRAEGLGLPVLDAVASGVPVIATAFGGTLDVVPADHPLAVPFEPVQVGPDAAPYPPHATWAEPDLGIAAARIAAFIADPQPFLDDAAERARIVAGRTDAVCGARLATALEHGPDGAEAAAETGATRILHFPKTAGTSVLHALSGQRADLLSSRFRHDRATFGTWNRFAELPAATRATIAVTDDELAELAAAPFACGHFYLTTLLRSTPPERIVTVLREPRSRLLSLYTYWRGLAADAAAWAPYDVFARAAKPLDEFLADESLASEIDNVYYRMSVRSIADARPGFVDPALSKQHADETITALDRLSYVGVMEAPDALWSGMSTAFGATLRPTHANATDLGRDGMATVELTVALLAQIDARTAVDQVVHHTYLARVVGDDEARRIADATFMAHVQRIQSAARHAREQALQAHIDAMEQSRWWRLGQRPRGVWAKLRRR